MSFHPCRWSPTNRSVKLTGMKVRSGCDVFLFASSPVCRSSGDAAAWRRHQHRVSLLGQADPLLHQPSFTLNVLLRLFCSQRKARLPSTTLNASLQLRGGRKLTVFVDDFLDLLVEVLPAFDQRLRPALPEAVQILFL